VWGGGGSPATTVVDTTGITPGAITSPGEITAEQFGCVDSDFFAQLAGTRIGVVSRTILSGGESCTWGVTMTINNDPGASCRLTGEVSYFPESSEPLSNSSVCAEVENARLEINFAENVRDVDPIPVPIDLSIRFPVSFVSINENGQSLNHPLPSTHRQTVDEDFNTIFNPVISAPVVFSIPEDEE